VKSSEGPWTASSSSSAQDLYPISKSWCHEPQIFYHEKSWIRNRLLLSFIRDSCFLVWIITH
jgi:hypothetical protein